MSMHCAESRLQPSHWLASFFKADQARCRCPEFACMNAMIFWRKLGVMTECSWECARRLALRIVCMCLLFPIRRTRSCLVNATTRADTVIATWRRRQSVVNTTSVRVRWRILRNYAMLWGRRSRPGATNISTSRPKNFAISRPPAKILCAHFGLNSITRFSNVWCACDYGKQRTIVSLCAERSTTVLSVRMLVSRRLETCAGRCHAKSFSTEPGALYIINAYDKKTRERHYRQHHRLRCRIGDFPDRRVLLGQISGTPEIREKPGSVRLLSVRGES